MNALVTGGGGFLGLYLTEQLVARGERVRVFCRGAYRRLEELGVEVVRGDVRDAAAVREACAGMDVVFHAAAVPGIWGPWSLYHGINTLGTLNVIAGCREAGVGRLVYTSSPSVVYDNTSQMNVDESCPYPAEREYLCHYPRSKMLAEKAVLEANGDGLSTVALRPHLLWGPRDNHLVPQLIRNAKKGRLWRVGEGENVISVSYVENAARAHLQAADALAADSPVAGEAYFIADEEPVRMWDWIDELLRRAGLPPVKKRLSARTAWCFGGVLEGVYRLLRLPGNPPMTRFLAMQLSSSHSYDVSKARRDFGYAPEVSFEEGMWRLEPELREWGATS